LHGFLTTVCTTNDSARDGYPGCPDICLSDTMMGRRNERMEDDRMSEMTEPRYVEYALTVAAERTDEAVARLQGRGIEYVWIDTPIETFVIEDGYGFREAEVEEVTVRAYEEVHPELELTAERLEEMRRAMAEWMAEAGFDGMLTISVPEPVTEDPAYQFAALEVKPGLMIRPPWDDEREVGERTLIIEPSAVFGTGEHPTTRHCLALIDELVKPGDAVADLGAGSGILSLLAKQKGAGRVVAVDLDPSAKNVIAHHMKLNDVSGIEVKIGDVHNEFAGETHEYDLVVVNIGGKEAIALAPLCHRIVKPDGVLLLSGIVEWIEDEVIDVYRQLGWHVTDRLQGEEWLTLALRWG
jgi:ribosomal protein L11 methyltransferase